MTTRRAFLIVTTAFLLALGSPSGNAASIAAGYDSRADLDNDRDVDIDDLQRLGQVWIAQSVQRDYYSVLASDAYVYDDSLDGFRERLLATADGHEPGVTDVNLTPEGGYFELPGGLVIDAPAGAVSANTLFQIRLLDAEEVEPYLDIGQMKKSFLGGFEVTSDGPVFDVPVWVQFPVAPLPDPNCLPYLFHLDQEKGTLVPDRAEEAIPRVPEASAVRLAGSTVGGYMYDPRDTIAGMALRNLPSGRKSQVLTAVYDVLGDNDCVANPCRCESQRRITEGASDLASEKCSKTSISGSIDYADCQGETVQTWSMEEESLVIAYTLNPNGLTIPCKGSRTLTVEVHDIDGVLLPGYEVEVTSSRPDLLEVTSFGGGLFDLERIGTETGKAEVTIDAGCEITRTIDMTLGCEIPDITGEWLVSGRETWSGCMDPDDDGTYPYPPGMTITFDSQVKTEDGAAFSGSFSFVQPGDGVTLEYTETYHGEIRPNCEANDECLFDLEGSTNYTEKYIFHADEGEYPFYIRGRDEFSGELKGNVITLSTSGQDTSGDSCASEGEQVLRR